MKRDTLLVAWHGASENERKAMAAVLQAIADNRSESVKWSSSETLRKKPVVEIFAAARRGEAIDVHFIYDFRIGRWAQSGSDWDEHHIHVGHATFLGGHLVSRTIEPDMVTIAESWCDSYDEAPAVDARRATAIAGLEKAQ
jgi:hypothetical protein